MPDPAFRLTGDDVPPLPDLESAFATNCDPDAPVLIIGVVPDPGSRWTGIAVVLYWDGQRVHYTATRNPIRYWLARRRADRAYEAARAALA